MMKLAPCKPYHFSNESIINIAKHYSANYLGSWTIKDMLGNWSERPVEVFYQPNPDVSKGHTHYFGIFANGYGEIRICKADSAFSEPIVGIVEDDVVYVSRYRHDCVETPRGSVIDGGRDYTRVPSLAKDSKFVTVKNINGEFVFEKSTT